MVHIEDMESVAACPVVVHAPQCSTEGWHSTRRKWLMDGSLDLSMRPEIAKVGILGPGMVDIPRPWSSNRYTHGAVWYTKGHATAVSGAGDQWHVPGVHSQDLPPRWMVSQTIQGVGVGCMAIITTRRWCRPRPTRSTVCPPWTGTCSPTSWCLHQRVGYSR